MKEGWGGVPLVGNDAVLIAGSHFLDNPARHTYIHVHIKRDGYRNMHTLICIKIYTCKYTHTKIHP